MLNELGVLPGGAVRRHRHADGAWPSALACLCRGKMDRMNTSAAGRQRRDSSLACSPRPRASTADVESAAGVQAGEGRTSLTAAVPAVALLFLFACSSDDLAAGRLGAGLARRRLALLFVGPAWMLRDLDLSWTGSDTTEVIPAAVTALEMPFTARSPTAWPSASSPTRCSKLFTGRAMGACDGNHRGGVPVSNT